MCIAPKFPAYNYYYNNKFKVEVRLCKAILILNSITYIPTFLSQYPSLPLSLTLLQPLPLSISLTQYLSLYLHILPHPSTPNFPSPSFIHTPSPSPSSPPAPSPSPSPYPLYARAPTHRSENTTNTHIRTSRRSKLRDLFSTKMAATGNLKFAIFVITLLALAAGIALIVQITKVC